MVGIKVKLDDAKMKESGLNDVQSFYDAIDALASRNQLRKQAFGEYVKDGEQGFAMVGRVVLALKKTPWFLQNVEEWIINVDGVIEDLVAHYRETGLIHSTGTAQNRGTGYER